MDSLVSVIIVGYNSKKFLVSCIESVLNQTHKNIEILFLDNGSSDNSFEFVKDKYPQITSIQNGGNIGLDCAQNKGINLSKGEFICTLNLDVILDKDYLKECVSKLKKEDKIGAISGKVYKYDFENNKKTNFIDTVGIFAYRNRRFIDDGQGLEDKGQFNEEKEVFGVSGACPVYRRKALDEIKYKEEYSDEDFFMYKDDVDIAWRFQLMGWKSFYLPTAIAHHGRGTGVLKRFTHIEIAKNRSNLSKTQKHLSYRNQRLMQLKNELFLSFMKDFFHILFKEILITGYIIFREPYLIKSFFDIFKKAPSILRKRSDLMKKKRVGSKEISKWFSQKESSYILQEREKSNI